MLDDKKIYDACLKAIQTMGLEEFKKCSWFGWKKSKRNK